MSDKPTNPYTGLPDDLYKTYASVKVFEHPLIEQGQQHGYNPHAVDVCFPEGWELITMTQTEKIQYDHNARSHFKVIVPVYICGRRRDEYMDDLRARVKKAEANANDREYYQRSAKRLEEDKKKDAERHVKEIEELNSLIVREGREIKKLKEKLAEIERGKRVHVEAGFGAGFAKNVGSKKETLCKRKGCDNDVSIGQVYCGATCSQRRNLAKAKKKAVKEELRDYSCGVEDCQGKVVAKYDCRACELEKGADGHVECGCQKHAEDALKRMKHHVITEHP